MLWHFLILLVAAYALRQVAGTSAITASSPVTTGSSASESGIGIVNLGSFSLTRLPLPIRTARASGSALPTPSGSYQADFGIINQTLTPNTSDIVNLQFTSDNDLALSILANQTNSTDTGNQTVDELVRKGRWLLGSERQWLPRDKSDYGNFSIFNCGTPGASPYNYGEQVRGALARMHENLISVDYEVRRYGVRSRYGFNALFKSNRKRIHIETIYEKMLAGASVVYRPLELAPGQTTKPSKDPQPVRIYCFRPDVADQMSLLGHARCLENPDAVAFWILGGSTIGLCPLFFDGIELNPAPEDCPSFSSKGQVTDRFQTRLTANQEAALVHELAHMYIAHDQTEEAQTLQDAMDLDSRAQAENPANYAYFYSSVSAGCRGWPKPDDHGDGL